MHTTDIPAEFEQISFPGISPGDESAYLQLSAVSRGWLMQWDCITRAIVGVMLFLADYKRVFQLTCPDGSLRSQALRIQALEPVQLQVTQLSPSCSSRQSAPMAAPCMPASMGVVNVVTTALNMADKRGFARSTCRARASRLCISAPHAAAVALPVPFKVPFSSAALHNAMLNDFVMSDMGAD